MDIPSGPTGAKGDSIRCPWLEGAYFTRTGRHELLSGPLPAHMLCGKAVEVGGMDGLSRMRSKAAEEGRVGGMDGPEYQVVGGECVRRSSRR